MTGIPMRPGEYHLMIITGDAWGKAVQLWAPGPSVLVSDLAVGDRIFYNGRPERIYSITLRNSTYTVELRDGILGDPWFQVSTTKHIRSAVQEPITNAEASWLMITNPVATPFDGAKMIIPTTVVNNTVNMIMLENETADLEDYQGVWKWDLHCQVRGKWISVLAGTMIIERSVSRLVEA